MSNLTKKNLKLYRIGVVVCSITATVYYGGLCTHKYISDPISGSTEMVSLDSDILPPLKWSICKQVTLTDCIPDVYYDLFEQTYIDLGFN